MSDKNNVRVVRKSFYSTFRMHFATVIEREKKEKERMNYDPGFGPAE